MLNKFVTLAAIVFSLWSATATAQIPDLVRVGADYLPAIELDDPDGLEAQVTSYHAILNLPIVINDKTFLIPGIAYRAESVSFSNEPDDFIGLRALHAPEVHALFVRLLPKEWSFSTRLSIGLAGDFKSVDSRMIRGSGLVLASKSFSDQFRFGFGGLISFGLGELLPLPAIYLQWEPAKDLLLETFVPGFLVFKWTPGDAIELGIRSDLSGNAYAVRDERFQETPSCVANSSQCLDRVAYARLTAGLHMGAKIWGPIWALGSVGRTVFRRFEQINAEGDRLNGGLQNLPGQFYVSASLVLRIPRGD